VKPVLQSLVLAERIYRDVGGQYVIAGTFNALHVKKNKLSGEIEREDGRKVRLVEGGGSGAPWVYIGITDVCDGTKLNLQFVSLDKNKILFETNVTITNVQRLQLVEIAIPLPHFQLEEPGTYAFEIVCDGEIVGSHRLVATVEKH